MYAVEIDQKNVAQVLDRFYNCEDALLHSVSFALTSSPSIATATIETQDREAPGGWSTLVLTVSDVTNAQLIVGRIILQIMSNGIQIVWKDELVYLVLDAYPDDGPGLPDLAKNNAFIAGSRCSFSATPIERRSSTGG